MGEVLNHASAEWSPQLLAGLYAAAALEAGNAHAAERDLITQHHGIARGDLEAVLELAQKALDGQHAVPGKLHQRCSSCDAALALGRVRNAGQVVPERRSAWAGCDERLRVRRLLRPPGRSNWERANKTTPRRPL